MIILKLLSPREMIFFLVIPIAAVGLKCLSALVELITLPRVQETQPPLDAPSVEMGTSLYPRHSKKLIKNIKDNYKR